METWQPISDDEFSSLFNEQYAELNSDQKHWIDKYRVHVPKAVLRRSEDMGDELVHVVARIENDVLYFDDVEYGFNWSEIDGTGRILKPGGSQNSLQGALIGRFTTLD